MSRLGSAGLQDLINQITSERTKNISEIESLFTNFGVSAKADIKEGFAKEKGRREQDLISRGLSQTTRRETSLADLAGRELRESARVDESVAGQKASFKQGQLLNPALIASLITQASSVDTTPQTVRVGASNVGPPTFGLRPGDRGTGSGGGGGTGLPQPSNFQFASGSPGSSARIVTRTGSFTPQEFQAQRGQQPGGAQILTKQAPAAQAPAKTEERPTVKKPPGTGSITNLATGQTTTTADLEKKKKPVNQPFAGSNRALQARGGGGISTIR